MPNAPNGPGLNPGELPFRLGAWVPQEKDPRRYAMRHFLEEAAPATAAYYNPGKILDQGETSSCVGHAGRGYELMDPSPFPTSPKDGPPATLDTSIPAIALYKGAQDDDPWPGSEWQDPKYEGTSLSGLAKYMQTTGLIQGGYAWAQTPDDVSSWLRTKGPIIFASLWRQNAFHPTSDGFIHFTGSIVGGHAYRIFGIDKQNNWYMVNNWGEGWGLQNQTFTDLNGRQFTVKGSVAKVSPTDQPLVFADHQAEGFAPVKASSSPPTPPTPPSIEHLSLTAYVAGGYKNEVYVTKRGKDVAYSVPV